MASSVNPISIWICGFNGEMKEWMIPSDINFRMVLVSKYFACDMSRVQYVV